MTTEPDRLEALKPCRACGAACRVETFGPGGQLFTEVTLWVCSRTELFGGSCPDRKGYFSPKAWNTRPIETNSRTGDTGPSATDAFEMGFAWRRMLSGQTLEDSRAVGRTLYADVFEKVAPLIEREVQAQGFNSFQDADAGIAAAWKIILAALSNPSTPVGGQGEVGEDDECPKCHDSGWMEFTTGGFWIGHNMRDRLEICDCICGDDVRREQGVSAPTPQSITPPEVGGELAAAQRLAEFADTHLRSPGSAKLWEDRTEHNRQYFLAAARVARSTPEVGGELVEKLQQVIIDGVRECMAQVVERHKVLKLCRTLAPEAPSTFFAAAGHLADDIRHEADHRIAEFLAKRPAYKAAIAALSTPEVVDGTAGLVAALEKAQALIECIEQRSYDNCWWVNADDPETVCCDVASAVDEALSQHRGVSRKGGNDGN